MLAKNAVPNHVKLWVDDSKDPDVMGEVFGFHPEEKWLWAKTAQAARAWLFHVKPEFRPVVLALDHDLGLWSTADGRGLAHEILDRVLDDPDYIPPAEMVCISYNPLGEEEILKTFADIRKVLAGRMRERFDDPKTHHGIECDPRTGCVCRHPSDWMSG